VGVDIGSGGGDDMVVVVWVVMWTWLRWVNEPPHFGPNARALDGGGYASSGGSGGT